MPRTVTEYDPLKPVTITLVSLADGNAFESTAIDNQTDRYLDAMLEITIVLSGGSPPAGAYIGVFIAPSVGGTLFPTPATGTNLAITIPDPTLLIPLGQIPVSVGGVTLHVEFTSVATALAGGLLPRKWSVIIQNKSGVAFTGSGHVVQYGGVYALTI